MKKAVVDDPFTDMLLRLDGWNLCYRTEDEAISLARFLGMNVIGRFFDEPLKHHCMIVAQVPRHGDALEPPIPDTCLSQRHV
jgi:hypothetical protein